MREQLFTEVYLMATQTTKGSGNLKKDFSVVLAGGNIASTKITNNSLINNAAKYWNAGAPVPNPLSGIQPVQLGTAVSITAITQSGSTGYVNIQKSSHGLAVGDIIKVYGANVSGYNVTHTVTVVTDANNVKTNVRYSADTSTHGSYKPLSNLFNTMTERCYIIPFLGKNSSGVAIASLTSPCGWTTFRRSIAAGRGDTRLHVTDISAITGTVTYGASRGNTVTYIDPVTGSATTQEAAPTRAIPGEFTYSIGKAVPTMADYKQRNA
jgi:hypothetical protein